MTPFVQQQQQRHFELPLPRQVLIPTQLLVTVLQLLLQLLLVTIVRQPGLWRHRWQTPLVVPSSVLTVLGIVDNKQQGLQLQLTRLVASTTTNSCLSKNTLWVFFE
jgi:hypothetical protein